MSYRKKCPKTFKTMYNTERQAGTAMMHVISHDPHANMFDLHVYLCPDCGKWHFGHQKWFVASQQKSNTVSTVAK